MNKIHLQEKELKLIGEVIEKNDDLFFKAENISGEKFNIESLEGIKIISIIPDIKTSVCDIQTKEFIQLAETNPKINFISISENSIDELKNWCGNIALENLHILSDLKDKDFAKKTNLLIEELDKLARAVIILDQNNKVASIKVNDELVEKPDFSDIKLYV